MPWQPDRIHLAGHSNGRTSAPPTPSSPRSPAWSLPLNGRPSSLTPAITAKVCEVISAGCCLAVAAAYVGVSKRTIQRWMKLGRKKGPYRDFRRAVQRAKAQAEMRDVLIIGKASQKFWQAAAWRLERRYPHRWGRSNRDKAVEAQKQVSPEEYANAIARVTQQMRDTVPSAPPGPEATP